MRWWVELGCADGRIASEWLAGCDVSCRRGASALFRCWAARGRNGDLGCDASVSVLVVAASGLAWRVGKGRKGGRLATCGCLWVCLFAPPAVCCVLLRGSFHTRLRGWLRFARSLPARPLHNPAQNSTLALQSIQTASRTARALEAALIGCGRVEEQVRLPGLESAALCWRS